MKDPTFIVIDLFCGAGGTTEGFVKAFVNGVPVAVVAACVNHDAVAIESHWANHPEVYHFNEDITRLYGTIRYGTLFQTPEFVKLKRIVDMYRAFYPGAKVILWASLECTNFSNAKGGQPRDADSRTLAEHLHFYVDGLHPDYVQIENVVEFMAWGPLDVNGKPISRDKGKDWIKWRNKMKKYHSMTDVWNTMNSANYGAYTSRNRLFGCFATKGTPITWPKPTYAKKAVEGKLKWKPVKDVLDFDDEGNSIFTRDKALVDKTLERIYAGLVKFIAKGDTSFLSKYYSGRPAGKVIATDGPAGTITTSDGHSLIQPEFLIKYYGTGLASSIEEPAPTVTINDRFALIKSEFFIDVHFGYTQNQSVNQPIGTILPNDKHRLVEVVPFIVPTNYDNQPTSVDDPLTTITANRKYHYIVNPSHGGNVTGTEVPCPVIIARQDKAPLYLVQAEKGSVAIAVFACDTEIMIKIKLFMSYYGLSDIRMRMLKIPELKKIQGFPDSYVLKGTQKDQKKFIGNSVEPNVVKSWAEALAIEINRIDNAA